MAVICDCCYSVMSDDARMIEYEPYEALVCEACYEVLITSPTEEVDDTEMEDLTESMNKLTS